MSNKTLKSEYIIGNAEIQSHYYFIFNGGKVENINTALEYIDTLPILNKKPIRVRNKKGQMIALVGTKGSIKKFDTDYCNKTWYFDGNKLGKRKRLIVEAFIDDNLIKHINIDGLDAIWKKISSRMSF